MCRRDGLQYLEEKMKSKFVFPVLVLSLIALACGISAPTPGPGSITASLTQIASRETEFAAMEETALAMPTWTPTPTQTQAPTPDLIATLDAFALEEWNKVIEFEVGVTIPIDVKQFINSTTLINHTSQVLQTSRSYAKPAAEFIGECNVEIELVDTWEATRFEIIYNTDGSVQKIVSPVSDDFSLNVALFGACYAKLREPVEKGQEELARSSAEAVGILNASVLMHKTYNEYLGFMAKLNNPLIVTDDKSYIRNIIALADKGIEGIPLRILP